MSRLDAILASRRARVLEAKEAGLGEALRREADALAQAVRPLLFEENLRTARIPLIAEIKKKSPSAGIIAGKSFDPLVIVRAYAAAGAAAVSVVVERDHFDGDPGWVPAVARESALPVLWKDFVVDELVIHEAKVAGASAVLLIVAALTDQELSSFHRRAEELQLSILVEVHDEAEAARALSAGARIVGVNSRDLTTFEVDLAVARRVVKSIPRDVIRVAESGIRSSEDVRQLREAGFDAFLIGETLMRAGGAAEKVRELFGVD